MDPGALVVTAEHWSGAPGHLHAEGSVLAVVGDDRITASSADVDGDTRSLVVHTGRWERAGLGTLAFAELTLHWDDGWTGVATDADFRGSLGSRTLHVTGERLEWLRDGTLHGERVEVAPCDCDHPPLSVSARTLTVTPGEKAAFRGGWLSVYGLSLVPVPAGEIPLARRSGLLPPVLGYDDDGFRAALPVYLTLGQAADLTITPEVRTERSVRGLGTLRYALPGGTGTLSGMGGTDWVTETQRGAGEWAHRASRGMTGAAVQAQVLGDPLYLQDYADAFLARTTPWVESRAWAGSGPLEIWGSAFQLDDRAPDRAGAAVRWPAPLPGGATAELEATGLATELAGQGAGSARLLRETWVGPVRLRPELSGGASAAATGWGTAAVELGLPAWRTTERGRETLEPSVRVLGGLGDLDPVGAVPMGGLGAPPVLDGVPPWSLEPGLRWSHTGNGSAELRLAGALRDEGWRGAATGGWSVRHLHGWLQAEAGPERAIPDLAGGGFGAVMGPVELGATSLWTSRLDDPLAAASPSAAWILPGPLSSLRLSAFLLFDLVTPVWQSGTGGIRWTHPARCLAVEGQARLDRDEPPAFRLMLDVDP